MIEVDDPDAQSADETDENKPEAVAKGSSGSDTHSDSEKSQ